MDAILSASKLPNELHTDNINDSSSLSSEDDEDNSLTGQPVVHLNQYVNFLN